MKHYYFIVLLVLLFNHSAYPQGTIHQCGTTMEGPPLIFAQNLMQQAAMSSQNNDPYTFKVRINYVQDVVPSEQQELKALDMVGVLNLHFNPHNIFFKYGGYRTINNLNTNYTASLFSQYNSQCSTNLVEIFIVESITSHPSISGMAVVSSGIGRFILINKNFIPVYDTSAPEGAVTLIHEMGHYFGLYHTFQKWIYFNNDFRPSGNGCSYLHNNTVYDTFMENLDGSEWDIFGDLIQDTAPDRYLADYNISVLADCSNINYSTAIPNCGETIDFSNFNPPFTNFMTYAPSINNDCRNEFTPGQVQRMIAVITNTTLSNKLIDSQELYQPYCSEVIPSTNIYSSATDPSDPSQLLVCAWPTRLYKYQKGFNYQFFNVQTGQPLDGGTFEKHQAPAVTSTNMQIQQLSQNTVNIYTALPYEWQVIPHGTICYNEPFVGGTILTSSSLTSPTVTTQNLDSQQVSSPTLINTLETQRFHTIIKETESGKKSQQTIYKAY